jgi:hypothetical protein
MAMVDINGRFLGWITKDHLPNAVAGSYGVVAFVETFSWAAGGGSCCRE